MIDGLLTIGKITPATGVYQTLRSLLLVRIQPWATSVAAVLILYACTSRDLSKDIGGTWKIDSVYTFYNGFGSMETTIVDLEQYTYLPNGQVDMSWSGTTRSMRYDLSIQDTLKYFEDEREVSRYQILELDNNRMVLKKDKQPLFSGGRQERYEIRYFSKVRVAK